MSERFRQPLMRTREGADSSRVGFVELFFDLVFVFAVTQISHALLAHLDATGAFRALFMLVAVWWVWIYTAWVLNWLNPESAPVRAMLFVLMLAGLLMSAAIPQAFEERGLAFAAAYAAMQVGRTLFTLWSMRGMPARQRNFRRILVWLTVSAALWITGGLLDDTQRWICWLAAIGLELLAPAVRFRVPGLGATPTTDWDVDGAHIAERCGLFVIIALGESLLVTGATFAGVPWTSATVPAFIVAVLGAVAMWWIYFDTGAVRAHHRIAHSDDPGRVARIAYTYLHLPIVAGIILCAVADELVLMHPVHADNVGIAVILGGPAVYLLGNALFKWVTNTRRLPPMSHMSGLVALLALVPPALVGHAFSALSLGASTTAILLAVAVWEHIALHRAGTRPTKPRAATGPA